MQEGEKAKGKQQTMLDGIVEKWVPQEFTHNGILHPISQFVVCGDQVTLNDLSMDIINTIIRHLQSWTILCSGTVLLQ
jgi:hypothetical protein